MQTDAKIKGLDLPALRVIHYPDPRLREACSPVARVDDDLRALVDRMFELMFASRGVGLAGPQVGVTSRLFIASPTFEPSDRRVYINPEILDTAGKQDGEEGCLSFPGIYSKVRRPNVAVIRAQGLDGQWFEETGEELLARIFLHESDHLDGRLLVDRMGSVSKMAHRKALRELEDAFAQ